jgi:hypothetical protein
VDRSLRRDGRGDVARDGLIGEIILAANEEFVQQCRITTTKESTCQTQLFRKSCGITQTWPQPTQFLIRERFGQVPCPT